MITPESSGSARRRPTADPDAPLPSSLTPPPRSRGASSASPLARAAKRRRSSQGSVAIDRRASTSSPEGCSLSNSSLAAIAKAKRIKGLATDAYSNGRLKEAFLMLSACLELDALSETFWLNRSLVSFDLQLFARSSEDASIALKCIRKAEETEAELGARIQSSPTGGTTSVLQRLDQGRKQEMNRLRAKAHLQAGEARISLGMLDEAADDLALAAQLRPTCPDVQQVHQTLRMVQYASNDERQRWMRRKRPKQTLKEHDEDTEGLFTRAEHESKVTEYVEAEWE